MTAEPILHVDNLSKTFTTRRGLFRGRAADVRAVDSVSFSLHQGETLGLVGETGSGKSTIGRLVLRLLEPSAGSIWFDGEDISHISRSRARRMRRDLQMVFQDPYGSLDPRMKVASIIAEPLVVHGLWGNDGHQRVAEIMARVGLESEFGDRYPHEFSGGQRQRIGIARGLAVDPDILLMDEPFGALDAITRTALQDELLRIWEETGKSILFVTHDIEEAVYLGDRVLLLGGAPARIVNEYRITLGREERRESEAFLREVDKVRNGLKVAIQSAPQRGET